MVQVNSSREIVVCFVAMLNYKIGALKVTWLRRQSKICRRRSHYLSFVVVQAQRGPNGGIQTGTSFPQGDVEPKQRTSIGYITIRIALASDTWQVAVLPTH